MKRLYLGNPLGVLYASEILDVNIRILCFPCIEEVNFYNQKPRNVTIHLGLIGQDTYVPIVSIVEITEGLYFRYRLIKKQEVNTNIKEKKETPWFFTIYMFYSVLL